MTARGAKADMRRIRIPSQRPDTTGRGPADRPVNLIRRAGAEFICGPPAETNTDLSRIGLSLSRREGAAWARAPACYFPEDAGWRVTAWAGAALAKCLQTPDNASPQVAAPESR